MNSIPYIDIHTHPIRPEKDTITVRNIFPGEGFAAFTGRNFYSVGLHPWHINEPAENNKLLVMIEDALKFDHVIFVGECGLDKTAKTNLVEQKRVFEAQILMAEKFEYPLIIHCVKAYNEILELHKKTKPQMQWTMHGYNGNLQNTKQMANKNFLFSFGETLFKANSKSLESFKVLSEEQIFFETDEYNGEVEKIYEKGAKLRNVSVEKLKSAVWNNFNRIEKSVTNWQ